MIGTAGKTTQHKRIAQICFMVAGLIMPALLPGQRRDPVGKFTSALFGGLSLPQDGLINGRKVKNGFHYGVLGDYRLYDVPLGIRARYRRATFTDNWRPIPAGMTLPKTTTGLTNLSVEALLYTPSLRKRLSAFATAGGAFFHISDYATKSMNFGGVTASAGIELRIRNVQTFVEARFDAPKISRMNVLSAGFRY